MNLSAEYLAGVFDSDGSFSISKRHIKRPSANFTGMLQLTWKNTTPAKAVMNEIVNSFGGSFQECTSVSLKSYSGTKPYLKYSVTGDAAAFLAQAMLPFLKLKKEQARNILELRQLTKSFTSSRPKHVTEQMIALYEYNRSLNDGTKYA